MQKALRSIILGPQEPSEGFRDLSLGHDRGFENPCIRSRTPAYSTIYVVRASWQETWQDFIGMRAT
jgi:hypothetical protein